MSAIEENLKMTENNFYQADSPIHYKIAIEVITVLHIHNIFVKI